MDAFMEYGPGGRYSMTPEQALALADPAFPGVTERLTAGGSAGFSSFRRAAQTPFNLVYEAKP